MLKIADRYLLLEIGKVFGAIVEEKRK